MKALRLTAPARARLREIVEYTLDTFGPDQAARYEEQLISRAEGLCSATFTLGRSCSLLKADQLVVAELQYLREGMHYLIYVESADRITVHDFVHVSRNLPALITALEHQLLR